MEWFGVLIIFLVLSLDEKDIISEIFTEHNKFLYNIALSILSNRTSAEDALQEAFLKIADNVEKIKKIECPQRVAYCVITVKNVSRNQIRSDSRTVSYDSYEGVDNLFPSGQSIEDEFVKNEEIKQIQSIINSLPDKDKQMIHLKWNRSKSYKEIADILNITEDAAKKRGQRAIKKVQDNYVELYGKI